MLSHFTSGTKCVFFGPHQPVLQCSVATSWVSYESRPFWHRPAGRDIRSHSRRAQAPKATPVSATSLWLFPWPPPLALWFARMANTFLMFTCLIWRPELRNSQRDRCIGSCMGKGTHFMPSHRYFIFIQHTTHTVSTRRCQKCLLLYALKKWRQAFLIFNPHIYYRQFYFVLLHNYPTA